MTGMGIATGFLTWALQVDFQEDQISSCFLLLNRNICSEILKIVSEVQAQIGSFDELLTTDEWDIDDLVLSDTEGTTEFLDSTEARFGSSDSDSDKSSDEFDFCKFRATLVSSDSSDSDF